MKSDERTVGWVITSIHDHYGIEWQLTRQYQEKILFGLMWGPTLHDIIGWFPTEAEAKDAMKKRCDPRKVKKWYNPDGSEPVGL